MLPLMITAIEDENDREFMEWLYLQYHRLIYSEVRKLIQNEAPPFRPSTGGKDCLEERRRHKNCVA